MNVKISLPLLPLRDIVVFPSMVIPLFVGRDKSISALNEVESEDAMGELERALEATTQEAWSYHISPREVGNKDGSEYYAFIWRDARVS